jgi:uncharacterized membrane protein (DUF2068 family)
MADGGRRDLGVRLIVLYKATKAVAEVLLALGLVALAASGEIAVLRSLAEGLRDHVASRWSLTAGRLLGALVSPRGVHLLETGLLLDGVLTAFEGFSLARGFWWGPWLVVAASALPLPLEIVEIARAGSPLRIALAAVNLAVVVYLVRRLARR